ncbi:NUDIX hydrolase [Ancylothrix sp. C2]|uniref:NUDIX hydrolase n=1 Tax=Ancylothrix sp. D3o TaxID=2953691 RepID=UPI0021BAD13C|nr:NUDIX hydrolase [Ancylothrix sp. D3o]MCT7949107.1 NUDIX hydrolase [Ancylothrix sp. D3o]
MSEGLIHVALAILYNKNGQFLMQLRDNIPTIVHPGKWSFFGGHLEPGEVPAEGVKRELLEEIGYTPAELREFRCYSDGKVARHIFYAPLNRGLDELQLNEGWDMGLITTQEIEKGEAFSEKAGGVWPLSDVYRSILLEFISQNSGLFGDF